MINFIKYQALGILFSLVIFVSFIATFVYKRYYYGQAFNYSVEFTGGTQARFHFEKPTNTMALTEALEKNGYSHAEIRAFNDQEFLIRVKAHADDVQGLGQELRNILSKEIDNNVTLVSIDSLSSTIGAILQQKSLYAIGLSILLMFIYIGLRFWSFSFGMGAVVSLIHDAIVLLLIFMIFNKEISLNVIGAILTVLGYSINDTIVVFARIRDNLKLMPHDSAEHIVNVSINQTLRRTLLTSFATLLVVIALLLLGGPVLQDLSLSLLIGILFGTYSSIYIASSVMLFLYKKEQLKPL